MPIHDMLFLGLVIAAFTSFAVVLAWVTNNWQKK